MIVRGEEDEEQGLVVRNVWKERREGKEGKEGRSLWERVRGVLADRGKVLPIICIVLVVFTLMNLYQIQQLKAEIEQKNQMSDSFLLVQASTFQKCYPNQFLDFSLVEGKDMMRFEHMLMHYLTPYTDTDCQLKRYGRKKDGGYLLCKNVISHSTTLLNFGISDDDSFGCDLATVYGIKNRQFDCTLNTSYFCVGDKPVLEKVCLGESKDILNGKNYNSYDKIIDEYKLGKERLVVKIDIEGAEWSALPLISNQMLDQIDQLVVELHLGSVKASRANWQYLPAVKRLLTKFVPVNLHMNNFGCFGIFKQQHYASSASFQVTLVNRQLVKLHSFSRSFAQSWQNFPNQPYYYDCQMK